MPIFSERRKKINEERKRKKAEKPIRKTIYEIREQKRIMIYKAKEEKRIIIEKAKEEKRIRMRHMLLKPEECTIDIVDESYMDEDEIKHIQNSYDEYKNTIRSYENIRYFENPNCQKYIDYIKESVESIFGNIEKVNGIDRSFDFILKLGNKRFKVKHLVSFLQYMPNNAIDKDQYCWKFFIKNNNVADAFLLTALDSRKLLNFQHMWFIKSQQTFKSITTRVINGKEQISIVNDKFQDRYQCQLKNSADIMSYMDKFELKEKLEELKKLKLNRTYDKHRSITNLLLFEKQQEIFEKTGKKRSIEYLIEKAIEIGFGKILEIEDNIVGMNNAIQEMLKTKLKNEEGKRKGIPREICENEIYNLAIEKQKELLYLTGELKSIQEIMDMGIESGIGDIIY